MLDAMPSFTERYHELTKYRPETIDRLGEVHWQEQPAPFKEIAAAKQVDLVPSLKSALSNIESFPDKAAPWLQEQALPALCRLLYYTLGITARMSGGGAGEMFLRAAPSAGGLYPTEVYVVCREFSDLPAGIYHYHSLRSALIPVWEGDFSADLWHHFLDHPAARESRCMILFTGLYGRGAWRYKERAYRRILLDTGHAAANMVEIARVMGLDVVSLGGFLDDGLEELLFLGNKEEFPLLGLALGPAQTLTPPGGQRPSLPPPVAVKRVETSDPMQVQQNTCERLYKDQPLRPSAREIPCTLRFDTAVFNPQSVIVRRRSTRRFTGDPIPLQDVEDMIRFAFRQEGYEYRLAPGQLEFHVAILAVEGKEPGIYSLNPETLHWTLKKAGDFREEIMGICLGQELGRDCAFALLYTSDMSALVSTYGDRGYRYACLDAGQIGERIQLWALHKGFGSSGIGGYYDDWANEVFGLPLSHGVLYLTVTGVPEDE